MHHSDDANRVNAWWANAPAERFWLDVTQRVGWEQMLAAPRSTGRNAANWIHRLITHVAGGDVVFHYDASEAAIVAWSVSHGRVQRHDLPWALPTTERSPEPRVRTLPSWGIPLNGATRLDEPLPLHEIARMQWELFPTLRPMEDRTEATLHYPFEMGSREVTRPIPGYVFKLPAVFVLSFASLSGAVQRAARLLPKRESAPYLSMALAVHPLRATR